jgi:protein TonB
MTRFFQFSVFILCLNAWGQDSLNCMFSTDTVSNIQYVTLPETEPEFPEGFSKLIDFIISNTEYPESIACGAGIIYVSFIIMPDGTIENVTVVRAYDPKVGEAVRKAVEKMPNWLPGTCSGETVPVKFTLPINIHLK